MISTVALSGLTALTVNAVSYSVSVYPNSVSVGDTVTVSFINPGLLDNEYKVGYSLGKYGSITYINNDWSSDTLYTFVPDTAGFYWVWCFVRDNSGSTNTYQIVDVSESSGSESSGSESSGSESSGSESSFDPMNWMPSDWRGNAYLQPSADSTPDLSYEELPNLDSFNASENLASIIAKAFKSFPAKLIVLMIPTIICLFIAWWLHK